MGVARGRRTDGESRGAAQKHVNEIQIALLGETRRNERRKLLDRLFQAEQILAPVGSPNNNLQRGTIRDKAVDLINLQRSLRPDEIILEYVLDEP